ncbi:MAG: lysophospholipid acyltransferase family protein [Alphaproteobacteria bacterium]|jgi:lysophospholipid acyltransferase (LPLAT)-like uncharacterized protein|nr:lysophospholipid acyltransferase family protein [Alphaproteobacteria bacterium]MBT4017426.1 lysophospholipid acyltransferase family protein [Alphaproteobacteria bacterium]MBT4965939.1 lysophospholipid acyltransferase family protein [Alphaproteobacteria bacterium]MBT5159126.1 lysophospholipid acyltransferase family protein [Alphaproteobacteria bacterium]MBT6386900.1 lysophospholipid acyltransferase family protein [Alphaproteobacteria bacterium]
MARPFKMIMKSEAVRRAACGLAALYIRFVHVTNRWQIINDQAPQKLWDDDQPFIVAFWHNRLLMMPYTWRKSVPINMLISQHRDGELIANTIAHLGFKSVRGSTSRDGAQALRTMLKAIKRGECIGITPDGPRGPRMRASDGIVSVARLAGVPILPVTYATSRRRILSSWDRFLIALPFGRGVFIWGDPIGVPREASESDLVDIRQSIENQLILISNQADEKCDQTSIEPAAAEIDGTNDARQGVA